MGIQPNKLVEISLEEFLQIEKIMYEKGYLTYDYILPEKEQETDVECPVCGEYLNVYTRGHSYRIICPTENCVDEIFRGL